MSRNKSVIIIGAGMGGLAAGIYGQMNGFDTQIFEMHRVPGGQCAAWKRKGYTFDACIHHLFGCDPHLRLYRLWEELGAMPRDLIPVEDAVSAQSPDGKLFEDFYNPERLREHLLAIAPQDREVIDHYIRGIKLCMQRDIWGDLTFDGLMGVIRSLPTLWRLRSYLKPTIGEYAERFTDPFLRRAFPLLEYSAPTVPFILHLVKHAYGAQGGIQWPKSGAADFAKSIEQRYLDLGGQAHYGHKVVKILADGNRAHGIVLDDGTEHHADYVISDADGRKTILELLEGRFMDDKIRGYVQETDDETNWAVMVFLGVNRDLSNEPSSLVMLLDEPVEIAGHMTDSIDLQMYGFDPTMAPEGKGVIKVDLFSKYSYWKRLAENRERYEEEKQRVADAVIGVLEQRFPGLREQVEVVDVPTLLTWERFMGGTHGFANGPKKPMDIMKAVSGRAFEFTLPGLSHFYFVGVWASNAGALFMNALTGRRVMEIICKEEGKKFTAPHRL